MRNLVLTFVALLVANFSFAQEVPNVIPPSPEAASLLSFGNTGVNFYTGQPSFSVPIHTVSVRGFQFPVSLSYSSFQGINIEAVAPWVGIGWSLNATGTVSRTIRGLADDMDGEGYTELNDFDIFDTTIPSNTLAKYGKNELDGEPDKFTYSVNGLSGSFFLDRDGNIISKTKTNDSISYNSTPGGLIDYFTIIDKNGITYLFEEKERTISIGLGQPTANSLSPVTSWYLTSVLDPSGNELMNLSYYEMCDNCSYGSYRFCSNCTLSTPTYTTLSPRLETEGTIPFNPNSDLTYTRNYVTAKRIKQITYPGGFINFQISANTRLDYTNDKYLDYIDISDGDSSRIKRFDLSYSYFDANDPDGEVPINSSPSSLLFLGGQEIGDFERRLKLDQVQELDGGLVNSLPPYQFQYNMDYKLPDRYSFAKDHWGFYNGQDQNTSPEPNYLIKVFDVSYNELYYEFGTANREAYADYTKAGVLEKVTYPTGGHTTFEFEGNTAVSDELDNPWTPVAPIDVPVNGTDVYFNTTLVNQVFTPLSISGVVSPQGSGCTITGAVYKTGDPAPLETFTMLPESGANTHSAYLVGVVKESGSYYIKLNFQTNCTTYQPNDKLQLRFSNETALVNKPVGGLRVKSITDHDGVSSTNDITRNFYYNTSGETGNSTGRIVNAPNYAFQRADAGGPGAPDVVPFGIMRIMRSQYPLMTTNGSYVGYGKVTVMTHEGEETGKSTYEFTTAERYPDFYDGYYRDSLSGEAFFDLGVAGVHEVYPFPPRDERDFLRGLLKKQTDYRWAGTHYEKVRSTENQYAMTFGLPGFENIDFPEGMNVQLDYQIGDSHTLPYVNQTWQYAKGIASKNYYDTDPTVPTRVELKYYNIYAGRVDLEKTTTRQYALGDTTQYIETISHNYWDDLADEYFNVSRTQTVDSKGDTLESRSTFVYDNPTWLNATVKAALEDKNMLNTVLEQESYEAGVKLSTLRNGYSTSVSTYMPSEVSTAKGANALETRVRYHKYDVYGNPIEVSQEDGMHITYIWGYNNTLPVAKIDNATYTDVVLALGSTPDLGDGGLSPTQEQSLRNMSDAFVTTIDYHWGIGIKSQTDPNGLTTTYEYDSFGRLKWVKDPDGNIINAYKYNYKGQ
ncbi:RHS repeat domain-containing protein [Roseivirga sp. 4D4]|uniref:RHS repeat domain-containing protein n=1 Tax=Roseivirga sp. 4D4 TaxID=1889784 RepID=UPI00147A33F0|nr:RHS repeat domain-containing protein [Roseivirga sp. 4D4]